MVAILATRKRQQREQVQKAREQQRVQEHKWRQAQQRSTGLDLYQQEQCQGKAYSENAVVLENEKGSGTTPAGGAQKWHKATTQWRRVRRWMVYKKSRRRESSTAAEDAEKDASLDASAAPSFFRRMSLSNMGV
jgi:hypothetical protein